MAMLSSLTAQQMVPGVRGFLCFHGATAWLRQEDSLGPKENFTQAHWPHLAMSAGSLSLPDSGMIPNLGAWKSLNQEKF
jgi:hypothetical protein